MKQKILIVDDDVLVLKSLRNYLSRIGYEIVLAKSGKEARDEIARTSFDLIISDVRMPGEDGLSFIANIKAEFAKEGWPEPPFLFITGYASEDAPIKALELEAGDYILKPFDNDQLTKAIEKCMSKKQVVAVTHTSLADQCKDVVDFVDKFHDANDDLIIENQDLRMFFGQLEAKLDKMTKSIVQLK